MKEVFTAFCSRVIEFLNPVEFPQKFEWKSVSGDIQYTDSFWTSQKQFQREERKQVAEALRILSCNGLGMAMHKANLKSRKPSVIRPEYTGMVYESYASLRVRFVWSIDGECITVYEVRRPTEVRRKFRPFSKLKTAST